MLLETVRLLRETNVDLRTRLDAADRVVAVMARWIEDETIADDRVMWNGYCETCCADYGSVRPPNAKPFTCAVHLARAALAAASPTTTTNESTL